MARRSKEDAEKTRAKILAEAKKLFVEQGYADTPLSDICEAAEITKGALFHYFTSKEKLFDELWTQLQVEMDAAAGAKAIAAQSQTDPYASFLAGCKVYFEWAVRRDYQQIVLIDGPSVLGMSSWYEADNHLGRDNTLAGMRWLAKKGKIDPELIEPLAVMFHNALNGAGFAISSGKSSITAESAFKAFEVMLRSMDKS